MQRADDAIQPPSIWDSLQLVLTRVLEDETGPSDEVFDGLRGEDFRRSRDSSDTRTDRDSQAPYVVVVELDLASVHASSNLDPKVPHPSAMAWAQYTARAGPSNVARKPSPIVLISFP